MLYLGLALFAEGPTDHAFLAPLLSRLCARICADGAESPVEVGPVQELHSLSRMKDAPREDRVFEAAYEMRGAWNVLFIHADAGGDPAAARRQRIDPAAARVVAALGDGGRRPVAVVPVRETEAWVLADTDAVRAAFGTRKSNEALGLPGRPRDVERLADPKQTVDGVFKHARGERRARRERAAGRFGLIAEQASLDMLSRVPAFRTLQEDLTQALRDLRYLPRRP